MKTRPKVVPSPLMAFHYGGVSFLGLLNHLNTELMDLRINLREIYWFARNFFSEAISHLLRKIDSK